jgi:hypothetical protein
VSLDIGQDNDIHRGNLSTAQPSRRRPVSVRLRAINRLAADVDFGLH